MNMADDSEGSLAPTPDPNAGKEKNLGQKMAEVQLTIGYIERRGRHPTKGSFLKITDLRGPIGTELASRNINFCPSVKSVTQIRDIIRKLSKGGERILTETQAIVEFTLRNADNPSEVEVCQWIGWAEGDDAYAASGAVTNAERRFWEHRLMLVTGEVTKKEWTRQEEAENAKIRDHESKQALERAKTSGVKIVGNAPEPPTADDLADSDTSKVEESPVPPDESWREMPLTMCALNQHSKYKGKTVGDITLEKLIEANRVFVTNVHNRIDGYTAPGHHQLANAFIDRIIWEIAQGNVTETVGSDGKYHHEIVTRP